MGSFVHCNVQYLYFNFLMLLFMNHCNDFAPCGFSIVQYNSYSYRYCKSSSLAKAHIFSNCRGRRENFGVFRVKIHDFTPTIFFFYNFRGGARPLNHSYSYRYCKSSSLAKAYDPLYSSS
jgi:hypothetical protein